MNLSLNDEFGEFILSGALELCKTKLKYVPWVIFYYNIWQGGSALVVDVGYEVDWFYSDITYDSIDGQELVSHYGPGGSPMKAIELFEE